MTADHRKALRVREICTIEVKSGDKADSEAPQIAPVTLRHQAGAEQRWEHSICPSSEACSQYSRHDDVREICNLPFHPQSRFVS